MRAGCYLCEHGGSDPDESERITVDEHWRAAVAFDRALSGWLVLVPTRHVESPVELTETETEAGGRGPWLRRLSTALVEVAVCARAYVALFAEPEGFVHVHVHDVRRPPQLDEQYRDPRVFGLLGQDPPIDRDLTPALVAAVRVRDLA